jgi:hypothetical protein
MKSTQWYLALKKTKKRKLKIFNFHRKFHHLRIFYIVLSAVDQQVGKHIFTKCIKSYFREKTVLFVTHQLQVNLFSKIF